MTKFLLIIPVVFGPTEFEDRIQCAFVNTFYLIRIETELLFVTIPVILAFVAVVTVSFYAVKLQIRLSREVQPQVNLPKENIIPDKNKNIALVEVKNTSGNSRSSTHLKDIQIIDLENSDTEQITIERIPTDEQESSISIKRKNSDPNHFFRVPRESSSLPPVTTGCFAPLAMIVERILMINISALCLALSLSFSASMRFYFVIKDKKAYDNTLLRVVFICFQAFFILTYVFLVRKKLCK